jgi:hypothetical protein
MHDWIAPTIIVPSIFYILYLVIKTISDNTLRRDALTKSDNKEMIESIFKDIENSRSFNFNKFGYIFIGIGVAAVISELTYLSDQMSFGLYTFFIGIAILVSNKIED